MSAATSLSLQPRLSGDKLMPSTWRNSSWEMAADEEDRSSSEWERISVPNASRATSPENMEINPFELEGIIERLERELAETQRKVQEQETLYESLSSARNHLLVTCENLRGQLGGRARELAQLKTELARSRAISGRNSQIDRQRSLELSREVDVLSEDVHMSKTIYSAINGSRRPTHLEEDWIFEEQILSFLLRGEVRKTIISIQKHYSVIMEVKSLTAPPGTITATCSLHDCVGFLYKMDCEDGERWRGDRKCLKLHYGELHVLNYGRKIPLGKSLEDALLNGTTTAAYIYNICGGKRLRRVWTRSQEEMSESRIIFPSNLYC